MSLAHLRKEYDAGVLHRRDLHPDPLAQFQIWLQEALASGDPEPTAMTLATVDATGQPSARTVLLKGADPRGFHFYTNYESRKGRELAANPRAALVFHWKPLERQVCVRGRVERLPHGEAEAYFHSRPLRSQWAAWASRQSAVVPDRAHLERCLEEVAARHGEGPVPLPEFWGGYVLEPDTVEFWQGRRSRLHDRLQYRRHPAGGWQLERLSP